tara:strand:+ start:2491 stop:3960 length:1470 start_codon:yes stop_codon:yes gene_type:complete
MISGATTTVRGASTNPQQNSPRGGTKTADSLTIPAKNRSGINRFAGTGTTRGEQIFNLKTSLQDFERVNQLARALNLVYGNLPKDTVPVISRGKEKTNPTLNLNVAKNLVSLNNQQLKNKVTTFNPTLEIQRKFLELLNRVIPKGTTETEAVAYTKRTLEALGRLSDEQTQLFDFASELLFVLKGEDSVTLMVNLLSLEELKQKEEMILDQLKQMHDARGDGGTFTQLIDSVNKARLSGELIAVRSKIKTDNRFYEARGAGETFTHQLSDKNQPEEENDDRSKGDITQFYPTKFMREIESEDCGDGGTVTENPDLLGHINRTVNSEINNRDRIGDADFDGPYLSGIASKQPMVALVDGGLFAHQLSDQQTALEEENDHRSEGEITQFDSHIETSAVGYRLDLLYRSAATQSVDARILGGGVTSFQAHPHAFQPQPPGTLLASEMPRHVEIDVNQIEMSKQYDDSLTSFQIAERIRRYLFCCAQDSPQQI